MDKWKNKMGTGQGNWLDEKAEDVHEGFWIGG